MTQAVRKNRDTDELAARVDGVMRSLGVDPALYSKGSREVRSPLTGEIIAHVRDFSSAEVDAAVAQAHEAFLKWRLVPAPRRGELVRLFRHELAAATLKIAIELVLQEPVHDVAAMLVTLLRDCRVDHIEVRGGIHPDTDPVTGGPLLFKGGADAAGRSLH